MIKISRNKFLITFVSIASVLLIGCGDSSSNSTPNNAAENTSNSTSSVPVIDTTDNSLLSEAQKYALAYMWNEERLAHDIYLNLDAVNSVMQLENIATKSETVHIQMVEDLIKYYDINITNLDDYTEYYSEEELRAMPSGIYGIKAIQDLYNTLYDYGVASTQSSLEVGCMVEVVDVDDLEQYLETSQGNQNLVDTFTKLRDDSYKHYWAFDKGLKNLGITDGCCSLEDKFCKTEQEYSK